MKDKLLKIYNAKQAKKEELINRSKESNDVVELRSIYNEIEIISDEIKELRSLIDSIEDTNNGENNQGEHFVEGGEQRSATGGFNPMGSYTLGGESRGAENEDKFATLEYRQAFKNYVLNGTPIPSEFHTEERSNELTVVGDIGAVIPTTILNKVIEDLTVEGKILSRVTQTSMQGGIDIPISDIMPTATWLNSELNTSEEQKAKMDAKLNFGYHVLEAKVAIGLLASTVSLSMFESTVVKQLKKAMIKAIETSIVKGTGSGQPKGLIKYDLPKEQIIEMDADTIGTVQAWASAEAAVDEAYEDTLIYMMNKATWEKYLNGMTDKNGQKIGLGRINEKGQKILNGREVLTCDTLPSFDGASEDEVFGALVNLEEYMLNSNLSMYYKKYFNEDTNKWIHKSLMIVDGKMAIGEVTDSSRTKKLVGAKSLIYLKKKNALSK